ncbi:TniQ family protein [Actinosynnema sp. NPDC047251]|uniref:TniQ domain-containing protein n=1 Tax=Saccharothrix espanaensis (strain ATCC 51144 / DSM 44229 / JCM 9112 / NBRC 15066 / NRRL 15764) TaxID=1179773 RepID=K0K8L8_SACES|nr:TniQ family protein [Saccharothrix espanaensis]CCH32988.1 hypothetical protein BN6_57300 [Saccharothrix espanaensis DSM 44229]
MSPARRWPLHPQPGPLESLSSWLRRLARLYDLPAKDLLTHNLGLVDLQVPELLDGCPPEAMLAAIAERTGVDLARLRMMTLAGWSPWLFDPPSPNQDREVFDNYVRDNSVLFPPRAAPSYQLNRGRPWDGPWICGPGLRRACPLCAADADRGTGLLWQLPLMVGRFRRS